MATIVMNMDGCDIAHEVLKLEEYGDEMPCAGWEQLAQAGENPVMPCDRETEDLAPGVALPSDEEEASDSIEPVQSAAFPKCP